MHRPRYHRTPAYLQDPDGSATGSAALGSSSAESRTETGSEISGGLPVGTRTAPRADNMGSGGPSAAARDAPDDYSAIEGLRFTGNTPPQTEADPPVNTLTTKLTLTSIPTLPPTLPETTQQSQVSSGTERTRRSLRLVNQINRAMATNEPLTQAQSLSPRKRQRQRDSIGPNTEAQGHTRSATTNTASTLNHK
ncbi:hypothetical protein BDV39DRAFT_178704 [Aspergillus sergii]|uniref:Uncharacterized protein n=1 Tax=Aspergillus sergii TaxID=1034303 RepID=A0A5N6WWT6_9EURO|nr:hypothetical protein BDV39DRAFT_178704 [Aspergillus sergii]